MPLQFLVSKLNRLWVPSTVLYFWIYWRAMQPSGTLESLVARLFLLKGVFVASSASEAVLTPDAHGME